MNSQEHQSQGDIRGNVLGINIYYFDFVRQNGEVTVP